jgi:thioredoxin 1
MKLNKTYIILMVLISVFLLSCKKSETKVNGDSAGNKDTIVSKNHKIEFVELGSVNCIPCKKMQPVMKSIETKYKGLVKVTFHDVWKDDAPAKKYGIELIPTQVFLDANGKELMRHEGFYAEEEIDKFLQSQGINLPQ